MISAVRHRETVGTVTVIGPKWFVERGSAALRLLERTAPEAFQLVTRYIRGVLYASHSGVDPRDLPAGMTIGGKLARSRLERLAGTMAFSAMQCKLYWDYRAGHASEFVPEEFYRAGQAERACIEFEVEVMRQVGMQEPDIAAFRDAVAKVLGSAEL